MNCEICEAAISQGRRCRRCGKIHDSFSADGRSEVQAITTAMRKAFRDGKFYCYYSGVELNLEDSGSPLYRSIDHRTPGVRADLVLCCMFINQMKSDLDEAEFKAAVEALAESFRTGQPANFSAVKFSRWSRIWSGRAGFVVTPEG